MENKKQSPMPPAAEISPDVTGSNADELSAPSAGPAYATGVAAASISGGNRDGWLAAVISRANIVLAVLLVLAGLGLFAATMVGRGEQQIEDMGRFEPIHIPLPGVGTGSSLNLGSQVTVNGTLSRSH